MNAVTIETHRGLGATHRVGGHTSVRVLVQAIEVPDRQRRRRTVAGTLFRHGDFFAVSGTFLFTNTLDG